MPRPGGGTLLARFEFRPGLGAGIALWAFDAHGAPDLAFGDQGTAWIALAGASDLRDLHLDAEQQLYLLAEAEVARLAALESTHATHGAYLVRVLPDGRQDLTLGPAGVLALNITLGPDAHFVTGGDGRLHIADACGASACTPADAYAVPTAVGAHKVWLPSLRTR